LRRYFGWLLAPAFVFVVEATNPRLLDESNPKFHDYRDYLHMALADYCFPDAVLVLADKAGTVESPSVQEVISRLGMKMLRRARHLEETNLDDRVHPGARRALKLLVSELSER
jgi:hypothetical protein